MQNNNQSLTAKDIDGKKIREQYFDGLLMGMFIVVVCCTIWSLFDIVNFIDTFENTVIIIICFSPFILLAILNRFVFGKILCVLSEDKLYYFNAETRMNSQYERTNGYVEYSKIEEVKYIPSTVGVMGRTSKVIILGEDFEISVFNANRSLVKEINKRR